LISLIVWKIFSVLIALPKLDDKILDD